MEHDASLRDALSDDGDLELRFQGGKAIPVHSLKLKLASSVLKDMITAVLDDLIASASAKRRRTATEGSGSATAEQRELPSLQVDGAYEDWVEVLRLIYYGDLVIGPNPADLTSATAFRIFPIADQYDLRAVHMWCSRAVAKTPLELWPSEPIASSQVLKHPGLVQWLALADSKQCTPLVETCLSHLLCQESDEAIHEAVASPHLHQLIDGLRPETKTSIICKMAGLTLGFQGRIPEINRLQPDISLKAEFNNGIYDGSTAMTERFFLHPAVDLKSMVVWDMERQLTLGQLEGHDEKIDEVAAQGTLAVSCQDSGPVRARVWNLETMQCTATLPGAPDGPGGPEDTDIFAACCIQGRVLLGQRDGIIKQWDVAASVPVILADLEGHTSGVNALKTSTSGSMVLSGSNDMTVRLWDLRTGGGCVRTMEGHAEGVGSVDMDGHCRTAVSGEEGNKIKLWDLGSGRCSETCEVDEDAGIGDVVMHESGRSFLSFDNFGFLSAWAVGSSREVMRAVMMPYYVPEPAINRLFASANLSKVAFCSISSSQLRLSVWK